MIVSQKNTSAYLSAREKVCFDRHSASLQVSLTDGHMDIATESYLKQKTNKYSNISSSLLKL